MIGVSTNAASGSYQAELINLSRLELSPILSTHVRWSSGSAQSDTEQLFIPFALQLTALRFENSRSARSTIEGFARLEDDWDGYGASSISQATRENALRFVSIIEATPFVMPGPEILPKPTGTISFEWEMPRGEVYLEIGDTRYSGFIEVHQQQQPIFLQGDADSLDQQILALIQEALVLPPTHSASVTGIRIQTPWHELVAA